MPTIFVEILGNATQFKRELDGAVASTAKANSGMSKMGRVAGVAGLVIAGGLAVGLGKAVSAAGDFEQKLNVLQATTGSTAAEMAAISRKAIALGADIKLPATSAKDAADAMLELAKGGLTARQAMAAAHGTLLLSAAAQISNAEAGKAVVQALNAFKLPAKSAQTVVDDFAGAANASTASMTDVTDAMQQAASGFHTLKVPIGDATTAIAELSNAGINGGVAGASLNVALVKLAAPTDKAAGLMKKLGIDAFDAQGNFIGMSKFTKQFSGVMAGLTKEQQLQAEATIFGTRGMKTASIVFGSGADAFDKLREKVTKSGQAQDLANAQTKGFKGAQMALQSSLETLQIVIGMKLLPVMTTLTNFLAVELPVAVSGLSSLLDNNRTTFEVLGAAVGVALAGLLAYKIGVVAASVATKLWAVATALYTAAQWLANAAVVAFNIALSANPIGLVVIAIAALVAGLIILYKNSDTARTIMNAAFDAMKAVIIPILNSIKGGISALGDVFSGVVNLVGDIIHGRWSNLWGDAKQIVSGMVDGIKATLTGIPGKILGAIPEIAAAAVSVGKSIVTGIINGLGGLLDALIQKVKDAVMGALDSVTGFLGGSGGGTVGTPGGAHPVQRKMAAGGIVTRPTYALIGEAGPEAVIPLRGGGMGNTTINVYNPPPLDERALARAWVWQAKHVVA